MSRVGQRGFTIVELLVTITVVGLLLAMILPAVQSSREVARKVQCQNNLRMIGVGLTNYQTQHRMFPPAAIWSPIGESLGGGSFPIGLIDRVPLGKVTETDPDRMCANWLVLLLPSLDQVTLWNRFDSTMPMSADVNQMVRESAIPMLKCPDETFGDAPFIRDQQAGGSTNRYARGNYAFNLGPGRSCFHELDADCEDGFHVDNTDLINSNGVFWGLGAGGINKCFRPQDIRGGLSQFIMVDEIRSGIHPMDPRGTWSLGYIGASLTARHGLLGRNEDANGPNNQYISSDDVVGCSRVVSELGVDRVLELRMPCWQQNGSKHIELNAQATARSQHTDGVHVLTADGSAHFVADNINPDIWFYLHVREPKQAFDSPF